MTLRDEASLGALAEDVVQTSAIEGETLSVVSVRSSGTRHPDVDIGALASVDRYVEGVVAMVLDATGNATALFSTERLCGWRDGSTGQMQVISGPIGRAKVHFGAPPAGRLPAEINRFLDWLNNTNANEAPYDGSIAYQQIQRERKAYYGILEHTQEGDMDVIAWLKWFLATLLKAVEQSHGPLDHVLAKAKFWQQAAAIPINERQSKVLNQLLNGFNEKLPTSKWAELAKCSNDTAPRDIGELFNRRLLKTPLMEGPSTNYTISIESPAHETLRRDTDL